MSPAKVHVVDMIRSFNGIVASPPCVAPMPLTALQQAAKRRKIAEAEGRQMRQAPSDSAWACAERDEVERERDEVECAGDALKCDEAVCEPERDEAVSEPERDEAEAEPERDKVEAKPAPPPAAPCSTLAIPEMSNAEAFKV